MPCLCCGLCCRKEKDTKVVSLKGLEPDQWHKKPKKSKVRSKNIKRMAPTGTKRPENGEEPTDLPGKRMDDDMSEVWPGSRVASPRVGSSNPKEPMYQGFMRSEATCPQEVGDENGVLRSLSPPAKKDTAQQPAPNKTGVSDGIHTDVRGAAPLPMAWKQLYADVLKPREQMMSLYRAAADRNAQRDPARAQNGSLGTPDDAAEPGRAQTPQAHRESKLQALKAQLRRKLINRRRRPHAARSREWTLETVVSDSEEGDEDDEILYRADRERNGAGGSACGSGGVGASGRPTRGLSAKSKVQLGPAYSSAGARNSCATSRAASRASCAQPISGESPAGDEESNLSSDEQQEPAKAKKRNALKRALKKITKKSGRVEPLGWEGAWAESGAPENPARPNTSSVGIQGPPDVNMTSSAAPGVPRIRTIVVKEMPSRTFK